MMTYSFMIQLMFLLSPFLVIMLKKEKLTKRKSFACTEQQLVLIAQKGIRDEKFRTFIDNYGTNGVNKKTIRSDEWKKLRDIIDRVSSLQLVGDVNSGKSFLVKQLIAQDKNHIFIVLDAHDEYSELPIVNSITLDIRQSCRIKLPDQPAGAVGLFAVYYNLIMNQQFPKHFVLICEEALRYKKYGIVNLLAESRKFIFVLAISQEKLVGFIPNIFVEPYNKINI